MVEQDFVSPNNPSSTYYPTCVGQLELSRGSSYTTTSATGNARQRRTKIRRLKAQGWTVYSCLRVNHDVVVANKR